MENYLMSEFIPSLQLKPVDKDKFSLVWRQFWDLVYMERGVQIYWLPLVFICIALAFDFILWAFATRQYSHVEHPLVRFPSPSQPPQPSSAQPDVGPANVPPPGDVHAI